MGHNIARLLADSAALWADRAAIVEGTGAVTYGDLAQRAGMKGVQEWLSFYFKAPQTAPGLYPEHDIFIQLMKLKNTLRHLRGEEMITHLGLEYYD